MKLIGIIAVVGWQPVSAALSSVVSNLARAHRLEDVGDEWRSLLVGAPPVAIDPSNRSILAG